MKLLISLACFAIISISTTHTSFIGGVGYGGHGVGRGKGLVPYYDYIAPVGYKGYVRSWSYGPGYKHGLGYGVLGYGGGLDYGKDYRDLGYGKSYGYGNIGHANPGPGYVDSGHSSPVIHETHGHAVPVYEPAIEKSPEYVYEAPKGPVYEAPKYSKDLEYTSTGYAGINYGGYGYERHAYGYLGSGVYVYGPSYGPSYGFGYSQDHGSNYAHSYSSGYGSGYIQDHGRRYGSGHGPNYDSSNGYNQDHGSNYGPVYGSSYNPSYSPGYASLYGAPAYGAGYKKDLVPYYDYVAPVGYKGLLRSWRHGPGHASPAHSYNGLYKK